MQEMKTSSAFRRISVVTFTGLLCVAGAYIYAFRAEYAADRQRVPFLRTVDLDDYDPMYVLEPFPPLKNPPTIQGNESEGKMDPLELVLGVEINGVARAYPINMLTGPRREIFAATW